MGLLFTPQVIYGHGEPWWNDIYRGKHVICPPELSGNSTSSHLVVKQQEHGKGNAEFCLQSSSFILIEFFYFPSKASHATDFYRHYKAIILGRA
jgi:hypothetical protein